MADTVQEVKDRLSIVDVVGEYVKLERAGSNMRARCPFHGEKTPSFFVSPERGTYHCFGCDKGGDIFSFIQEIEGIDFKGALKMLADKAGVEVVYQGSRGEDKDTSARLRTLLEASTIFFQDQFTETHPARGYLKERCVNDETIKHFRIGWAPDSWRALTEHLRAKGFTDQEIVDAGMAKKGEKGLYDRFRSRIMFPMNDTAGRVVAFSGRIFEIEKKQGDVEAAKYLNSPETPLFRKSRILYGFDLAKQPMRRLGFAILVEGQMDLVMGHQAGWPNTVAVSGTALTPEHVSLLKRMCSNLLVALDSDSAGVKAATKSAYIALSSGMDVKVAVIPPDMDPADIICKEGADAWKKIVRDSEHVITFLLNTLRRESKDDLAFQRAVETTVLPFLHGLENPIDKEKWTREVASRLGVSEVAVTEKLGSVTLPDYGVETSTGEGAVQTKTVPEKQGSSTTRLAQLWGLILWLESKGDLRDEIEEAKRTLKEVLPGEVWKKIDSLEESQKEKLRFKAESVSVEESYHKDDLDSLVKAVVKEQLEKEVTTLSAELRRVEGSGGEKESQDLLERIQLLTGRIAKL